MFRNLYISTIYFDVFVLSYIIANCRWSTLASMDWGGCYIIIINAVFKIA